MPCILIPLPPISLYLHTLRYLKPIQIFGRIRLFLPRSTLPRGGLPAVRQRGAAWRQPELRPPSLFGPAHFRLLNQVGEVRNAEDWNDPQREKLWLYHLHYFDDLNAGGAWERTAWHRALISRWIAENPVGAGNGWEPYPLSLRIVNWVKWAWAGNELPAAAAESLAFQARFLRRRLEWHILGNHLLANAKALIFAGLFFGGAEVEEWLASGLSILRREVREQILADGGHFERSPMYHAQVLEDLLDVVNALNAFPDAVGGRSSQAASTLLRAQCRDAASRMLGWLGVMTHPNGGIVLFNDAAFGGAAAPAALADYAQRLEIDSGGGGIALFNDAASRGAAEPAALANEARHLEIDPVGKGASVNPFENGASPARANPMESGKPVAVRERVAHLKDTGYLRVDWGGATAFLDVAPIGPDYLPGHAHADTLSFELSLGRQRVIVDSGVSRYGEGPERLRQRGTAAHNTVEIDGQDSSEVWGGFRVARRAYPRDLKIDESAAYPVISCAHDGYRRLPGKPVHRREWRFREDGLQIHDVIEGEFREAVGYLHFHPDINIIPSSDDCTGGKIVLPEGREIVWRIGNGRGCLSETTWHPEFGISLPNMCLEVHFMGQEILIEFSWK